MPKNFVLILTDQWRYDCLLNPSVVHTPFLDDLASQGTVADSAYSSCPTCVPARMSLLTGLKASNHRRVGYEDGVTFDVADTLAGCFSAAGYQTQAVGKMHVHPARCTAGFDNVILHDGYLHHNRQGRPDPRFTDDYTAWLYNQPTAGAFPDEYSNGVHCNAVPAAPWSGPERFHPTNWATDQAIDWLYRRDPTRPFLLFLSYHRPHAPYNPPAWAFDMYKDRPAATPVRGTWEQEVLADYRNNNSPQSLVADYPDDVVARAMAGYHGNITHLDAQIERFIEALSDFGLADETTIMFSSDHGDMMGDHGMWRKGLAYEGSSRIPLFATGGDVAPGHHVDGPVDIMDIMPTLVDLAGLPVPDGIDGVSFANQLTGGAATPQQSSRYLHGEHTILGQSQQWIVADGYKYIWWSATGVQQLFDLRRDEGETNDLLRNDTPPAETAGIADRMRGLLIRELTGREEGFVAEGRLVTGRQVHPVLEHCYPPQG
ncbi:arylsulfatase [Corynebacterium mendelii]|uniref:Arylsulfatase n=1 Tax=Corynebacterium mendelii TaxID=2765362 RepID=A0A939DYB2_9CORY|nr:arylsulfatase [Corynebacterium mendelii]MBN9643228.1 arylsulfatase [Corynebacterium mendelii]